MSLIQIKSVFQNLHTGTNWSLQLLNIKSSKRTGINYSSRQITLSPENRFYDFLNDIIRIYTGNGKKSLDLIENVREYDGTADSLLHMLLLCNKLLRQTLKMILFNMTPRIY